MAGACPEQGADPICAPATPLLPSAVAVVRVSGGDLRRRLAPFVDLPPPREARVRVLAWQGFRERALVLHFAAPGSVTGEDVVEFQVHGNPLLVRRLLAHLGCLGIRLATPGEFTRRALLNGRMDLLQAEALRDLVAAATDTQVRQAQARAGALPAWIRSTRERLRPWISTVEAAVEYGEEEGIVLDRAALGRDLESLRELFHVERIRADAARWLREGIRVALAGRPNSGKSTLFNALAGEDRAIVTELPGTTRDVLEVFVERAGLPLRLFDTAGLRSTEDRVEALGVARVAGVLEQADLVLHLVPATDPTPDPEALGLLFPFREKVMEVRTLADLAPGEGLRVCAQGGDLSALDRALAARFLGDLSPDACLGALATQRQRELLTELLDQVDLLQELPVDAPVELVASGLQGAWGILLRLTGEDRAEATLDAVFQGFCLGK